MESHENPDLSQWRRLYDAAKNIRLLAPWGYLWDTDMITIMLPEYDEPVYCSVMGRIGMCYGIGVYPGYASIAAFHRMAGSAGNEPEFISAFEQNCLICYFGDREEIMPKDREVMKSLGLRFRGRNEWIYFRSMEPGYCPWHLSAEQVTLMAAVLENLVEACKPYIEGKLSVDFENGETLIRFYSEENNAWLNSAAELVFPSIELPKLIISNDILIARLKKKKRVNARLEFEMAYFASVIQENKSERPYLPRIIILADKITGMILSQHMAGRDDVIDSIVIGMLADYIDEVGRPVSINVRDNRTGRYIEDLCRKTGIELIEKRGVPAIDDILEELFRFM